MNAKDSEKLFNDPGAFRQRVRMAAVQVAGLRPAELESALAYEVEPFSGIPASEAEVACRPVVESDPTVRAYDVAVRRRRGRTAAADGVGRLVKPAAVLAAVLLALAGVDAAWLSMRESSLAKTVAEQARLDAEIQRIRGAARARSGEARAIREAREAAAKAQDEAARRRLVFPELMSVIGLSFSDRAVLKSMTSGERTLSVRLSAVAATSAAAAEALAKLTAAAAAKGWQVKTGGMAQRALGTTVAFDCEVSHD